MASPGSSPRLLRIASNSEISAVDPHAQFLDTNINISFQIYEALTRFGTGKELLSALAEKWERGSDPTIWKFSLRKGVQFHSGQPFDKNDFLATLQRVIGYASDKQSGFISNVAKIDLERTLQLNESNPDPHELFVATKEYYRFLPHNLASIGIMQRTQADEARQYGKTHGSRAVLTEFANGRWTDGTGPYRFKSWIPLAPSTPAWTARVELEKAQSVRTDQNADWDVVQYIPVLDTLSRVGAVRSGQADVAVAAPASQGDLKRIQIPGLRVIHLQLFQGHDDRETRVPVAPAVSLHTPVKTLSGTRVANPLVSLNFRQALALAIDKDRLVELIDAQGKATEQYMQPGQPGYLTGIANSRFSLHAARDKLIAAANEPGLEFLAGTELVFTINGPEGRYYKDKEVLQAVARMWTDAFTFSAGRNRFSIRFETRTEPMSTYSAQARWYLIGLLGGGVDNGQGEAVLRLYLTPNSSLNYMNYSDLTINQLYSDGSKALDSQAGDLLFEQALKLALIDKQAMIPLYNTLETWAVRDGVCFEPRKDGLTLANEIRISLAANF